MKRVRIGNDLTVSLLIKNNGATYDLTGKEVKVYLVSPSSNTLIGDTVINSNNISFVFKGVDQLICGKYNVLVKITDGSLTHTLDSLDGFKLVDRSYKAGGSDGNFEVESVNLTFSV